jgi:diaminohydroxyphosphoribosylaminopyrimidine deaminase / 5-amino-6-(5-phosphoribosylamino)uracil reductase
MTTNHKYYLNLAFQEAKKNLGKTKLNPSVGTVIVKNKTIISSGVTSINGRPHAEYNALNKKLNFIGSDLYTTLEPCTHYGLTPPCVNIIFKKKIKNIYYCFDDPDTRTFKKAKKNLKKKKINCFKINNKKFNNFYSSYFLNKKFKIPFVSAKIAISKDFYSISKKSRWITNKHSKKITYLIRSMYDCIISTSKSINIDNSLLNCRIDGLNNYKPDLFIIDLNLKLKKNLLLNNMTDKRKTFIVTKKENSKKTLFYKKKGFKIVFVKSLKDKKDFNLFYQNIYKLGYSRAIFEVGLTFLNSLINHKLINSLYIFQNNKKLGINGLNNDTSSYIKKIKIKKKLRVNLKNDSLYNVNL